MTVIRAADACYLASLVCLPLIGADLIVLATGRDAGAGLQPAYFLLAAAVGLRLATLARPAGRAAARDVFREPTGRFLALACGLAGAALVVSVAGIVVAPSSAGAGEAWARYARQMVQAVVMACFVIYPALWTRGDGRWRATIGALAAGLLAQEVYALGQALHFLWPNPLYAAVDRVFTSNPAILAGSEELYLGGHFRGVPRLRGTACEPLYLGSYLLLVLPLTMGLAARRPWARLVVAAGVVLFLFTWSRGAVLAALAGLAAWFVLRQRAGLGMPVGRVVAVVAAALATTAALAALIAGGDALLYPVRRLAQAFDGGDWSNLTRLYSMQAAWRAFLLSPLVGVGWGQFAFHFPLLVDPLGLQSQFTWPVVNNVPLLVLCETGLVGFGALSLVAWRLGRATWRRLAEAERSRGARLALTTAVTIAVAAQLLTFSQYNLPHIWVAPGLWLAALRESETR
jgi:O-antigen ligase